MLRPIHRFVGCSRDGVREFHSYVKACGGPAITQGIKSTLQRGPRDSSNFFFKWFWSVFQSRGSNQVLLGVTSGSSGL